MQQWVQTRHNDYACGLEGSQLTLHWKGRVSYALLSLFVADLEVLASALQNSEGKEGGAKRENKDNKKQDKDGAGSSGGGAEQMDTS